MSKPSIDRVYRKAKEQAGLCHVCPAFVVGDTKLCQKHHDLHKIRNRRWHQKQIDEGKKRSLRELQVEQRAVREERQRILIAWAEKHGRVPSRREICETIGWSNKSHSTEVVTTLYFNTFKVRRKLKTENHMIIPYPVPTEWQA